MFGTALVRLQSTPRIPTMEEKAGEQMGRASKPGTNKNTSVQEGRVENPTSWVLSDSLLFLPLI